VDGVSGEPALIAGGAMKIKTKTRASHLLTHMLSPLGNGNVIYI
jgi:hypothetical protein